MNVSAETYVVVALAFAVFSAVTAIGSAIILGVGYERLRSGIEKVREGLGIVSKQTGFFATAIHSLDHRITEVEEGHEELKALSQISLDETEDLVEQAQNTLEEATQLAQRITARASEISEEVDLSMPVNSTTQLKPKEMSFDSDRASNDDNSFDLQVPHFYPVDEDNQIRYM